MDFSMNQRLDGVCVVTVRGEIDLYTAPRLRAGLANAVDAGHHHLVVDLDGIDFLDSTGVGVLVGALRKARMHDGSVRLVCNQERFLKIFRMTGLVKVFPIHTSLEDAVSTAS